MGLKYKNSSGEWAQVPIPSEINDTTISATTTYSSEKIENKFKYADLDNIIVTLTDINVISPIVTNESNFYITNDNKIYIY